MVAAVLLSTLALTQIDSSYDRLALWLSHGPGSTGVVQGRTGPLVGGGTFSPGTGLLKNSSDSVVRREYRASRSAFTRYTVLGGAAMAAELAAVIYYFGKNPHPPNWRAEWGIGLPVATLALGWAAQANAAGGDDHLRRALWLYNRQFQRTAAYVSPADCTYDRCALRVRPTAGSWRIVRGVNEISLGRVEAQHELFAAADDSARVHYEAFQAWASMNARARRFGLVAALAAGALYAASDKNVARDASGVLLVLAFIAGHSVVYGAARAESELDQAIWFYNRTLP
jgi:hypothetical protein